MPEGPDASPSGEVPPGALSRRGAAMSAWQRGDASGAEGALLAELAEAEKQAAGRPPGDPATLHLGQCLADLGCLYASHGSAPVADRLLVRALRLVEAAPGGRRSCAAAQICIRLSELRCRPRGFEQAEAAARRAVVICRAHPGLGPDHTDTARALTALGHSLNGRKKFDEAARCLDEALAICRRAGAAPARTMWLLMTDLADLARDRGEHRQALGLYATSLQLRQRSLAPGEPELLAGLTDLAAAHERVGDSRAALPLFEQVLAALDARGAGDDLEVASALHRVARTCAAADPERARSLLERAMSIEEKRLDPDHPAKERTLRALADIADRQHHFPTAVRLRERVVALLEKNPDPDAPETLKKMLRAVTGLCHSHCLAGHWEVAEDLDRRALFLAEKLRGFEHPTVAGVLEHSAGVLRRLGKDTAASRHARRAAAIRSRHARPGHGAPGSAPDDRP